MKAALLQLPVTADRAGNIAQATQAVLRAGEAGAQLAVLPEMFCCPYANRFFRAYGEPHGGPAQQAMARAAKDAGVYLVAGSLPELDGDRVYNTAYVYDPAGREIARHRKIHLFDIDVDGGQRFRESDTLSPGDAATVFDTAFGRFGLCICFDFRFQELSALMAQRGAQALIVPGAFNMTTGPAHWELLFRQRAVDNQVFTLGVAPARDETFEYVSYGNSIAVDPWGTVLCRAGAEAGMQLVELHLARVPEIRRQLPIQSARRTDLYGLLDRQTGHIF